MAKRSRGAARPGQRPTTRRPQRPAGSAGATGQAVRPSSGPAVDGLTDNDADAVVEQQVAPRSRKVEAAAPVRTRSGQASSLLTARAAEEYAYVAKDIRHIGLVGGGLLGVLLLLFVLLQVVHVVPL